MGWVVLLPTVALWWLVAKKINPRRPMLAMVVQVTTMVLAWVAGCGLAFTFVGRFIASAVSAFGGFLASITGEAGVRPGIIIAVTLVTLGIAVIDVAQDRRADGGAQFSAFVMPTLLALAVGGTLGATGGSAVQQVTTHVSTLVAQIGGS